MTILHRSYVPPSRTEINICDFSGVRENEMMFLTLKNAISVADLALRLIRAHPQRYS